MTKLDRDKLYPWLAILRARFMGSARAMVLAERFGSIENALKASVDAIAAVPRFNEEMARSVKEAAAGKFDDEIEKDLRWCEKNGVQIWLHTDEKFPRTLRQVPAPPALLYLKGDVLPTDALSLAIVGTRNASDAGKRLANRIAYQLAEAGLTIISGLAWGVDASAHKGALKYKTGRTLAVLGNGLKFVYPREHESLYEQVERRGALITELFHDVAPDKRNFPPRNRIISGLSLGVLVVEAPERSGALITADYALEQGREVFALPGAAESLKARGNNNLIADSAARLVTSADDILRELEDRIAYTVHEIKGEIASLPKATPPAAIEILRDGPPRLPDAPLNPYAAPSPPPESSSPEPAPSVKRESAPKASSAPADSQTESVVHLDETPAPAHPLPPLSDDEAAILERLNDDPVHIDVISRAIEWPIARASSALGLLELKGLIAREAGMRFRRIDRD